MISLSEILAQLLSHYFNKRITNGSVKYLKIGNLLKGDIGSPGDEYHVKYCINTCTYNAIQCIYVHTLMYSL